MCTNRLQLFRPTISLFVYFTLPFGLVLPVSASEYITSQKIHHATVSALALVGDYVISAGADGRVCTLNSSQLRLLNEARLPAQWAEAIAVVPDADACAVACSDGSIQAYTPNSRIVRQVGKAHSDWTLSLVFKDSKTLLSGGRDNKVVFSRWPNGDRIVSLGTSFWVQALALSKHKGLLAAGCWDGTVHIWSLADQRLAKSFQALEPHRAVLGLAFSEDGSSLYVCGQDKSVKRWNAAEATLQTDFVGQADTVSAMSVRGEVLITASNDGAVRIWSTKAGTQRWQKTPDIGLLTCMAISKDNRHCYVGSRDGLVARMDLPSDE